MTEVWVDAGPTVEDVRRVAASVITGSPLVSPRYEAWDAGDDPDDLIMGDGAASFVRIFHVREPNLTKLATEIRDAITTELGVRARIDAELPE